MLGPGRTPCCRSDGCKACCSCVRETDYREDSIQRAVKTARWKSRSQVVRRKCARVSHAAGEGRVSVSQGVVVAFFSRFAAGQRSAEVRLGVSDHAKKVAEVGSGVLAGKSSGKIQEKLARVQSISPRREGEVIGGTRMR